VHETGDEAVASPGLGSTDVLLLGLAYAGVALFVGLFLWGVADVNGDERRRLVADTSAPQVLDIGVGAYSPTAAEEFAAYYPSSIRARPGDLLRFTNPTVEDPHSVTFGLRADRSNQPRFATGSTASSFVEGPCVSSAGLTPETSDCEGVDDTGHLPAFAGQAFYNSGIIPPGGGTFELRLADELDPGTYRFGCVVHPAQVGTLEVADDGDPTQRPDDLRDAGGDQFDDDAKDLARSRRQAERLTPPPDEPTVRAGVATARTSLNAFLPVEVVIRDGDTVTWRNAGSVPHVVIFDGYLAPPEAIATPPTRPSGSRLSSGTFTSGPIGAVPYPRTSFSVRFDEPGSYPYVCTLHPGMVGSVEVLPP
jgi:plastocyanin